MTVLVDTSALYALLDRNDPNHRESSRTWSSLASQTEVVTHAFVVVEATALVQRRLGADAVRELHDDLLEPVRVVQVNGDLYRSAVTALLATRARAVSLVDFASFEFMRSTHIAEAFAFDTDFRAFGFQTIP